MQDETGSTCEIEVPPGAAAAVVTSLEMLSRPPSASSPATNFSLRHVHSPVPNRYRELFLSVGRDWLWFSRLELSDAELCNVIHDKNVEIYALVHDALEVGLLELDFRTPQTCEIRFFGLVAHMIGCGAGHWLMNKAIEIAWARPIERLWVHTCTHDHPGALRFYIRSGFLPFRQHVEIFRDPRLTGVLPRHAAPHIPIIAMDD